MAFLNIDCLSSAPQNYLAVKNALQVEPPSLETQGVIFSNLNGESPEPKVLSSVEAVRMHKKPKNHKIVQHIPEPVIPQARIAPACAPPIVGPNRRVLPQSPLVRMVDRKREETPVKVVQQVNLPACDSKMNTKNLKPNVRVKVQSVHILINF